MTRVFISYSHKDEALRAELDAHLALLKREGLLDVWTDHEIPAGGEVHLSISAGLEDAEIVLLLISQYLNASEYCSSIEMTRAVERHDAGECIVVPVLLRPCDWQTAPYARFNAIPRDNRPVTQWPSQDAAFAEIAKELRQLLGRRPPAYTATRRAAFVDTVSGGPFVSRNVTPVARSSNLSMPRRFTDQDRHDFLQETFDYVRKYFEASLAELQARNPSAAGRLNVISGRAFQAFIFQDGNQVAACYVRIGGMFGGNGIGYSDGIRIDESSYSANLTVHSDDQKLYLTSLFGAVGGDASTKLSQEGAAEDLWTRFFAPTQNRRR